MKTEDKNIWESLNAFVMSDIESSEEKKVHKRLNRKGALGKGSHYREQCIKAAICKMCSFHKKSILCLSWGWYTNKLPVLCFSVKENSSYFCSFTHLHLSTIKNTSVNYYIFIRYPKFSIVPFHNNNRVFNSNNAFLKLPHTPRFVTSF